MMYLYSKTFIYSRNKKVNIKMSQLTDFINNSLNPSILEDPRTAFGSMDFTRSGNRWISRRKLDGGDPRVPRKDKTVISGKWPNRVMEQGGDSMTFIDFYGSLNNINVSTSDGLIQVIRDLCGLYHLDMPTMEDAEGYKAYKKKLEDAKSLSRRMVDALFSDEGKATLLYLKEVRGYDEGFIRHARFGHVSEGLANDLRSVFSYTNKDGEAVTIPSGIGSTYTLSIPYVTGGEVKGFVFRSIETDGAKATPKYKNVFISGKDSKKFHLFGLNDLRLTGDDNKDRNITIVEGEIDALRATFAGIPNVVAASGGNVSKEALDEAKRRGVRMVTLLFDTEGSDEAQRSNYEKAEKAVGSIYKAGLSPYVCYLPSDGGKTDVDSFLRDHDGSSLMDYIDRAEPASIFMFWRLQKEAIENQGGEGGETTYKDLQDFKAKTISLCNSEYTKPTERSMIFKLFSDCTGNTITAKDIQDEADRDKEIRDRARQNSEVIRLTSDAYDLSKKGETDEALRLIEAKVGDIRRIGGDNRFSALLNLPSDEDIKSGFKKRPGGVRTGYYFETRNGREELLLPCGALTYVCAPTSHGKSRMLENMAIQLSTDGGEGDVLYFSFEEDKVAVTMQLLNIYADMDLSTNNMRSLNSYYKSGTFQYFKRGVSVADFQQKEADFMRLITSGRLRIFYEDYDSGQLIDAIRYMSRNIRVKAVFIDYIQLIHKFGTRLQRKDELKEICKDFMKLSVETGLPIVMAAQLNREAYSPIDMAVQNIAEASDIEHSANIVLLLWNSKVNPLQKSSYYTSTKGGRTLTDEAQRLEDRGFNIGKEGKLYVTIAKYRGGERNIDAILDFNGNTGRIFNSESEERASKGMVC